ncbi:MAG: hypothetical protein IPK32_09570 [Verrucomicrobiaceae bacterium]|nr:hypothetical protein [Verrucomicrobiaceae bacterium]
MSKLTADRPPPINGEDPTSEDTEFAEVFCEIAEMVEKHPSPPKMVLWLSTCRNHYLTLNAQFYDIKRCFGHGSMPSAASIVAYEFVRGRVAEIVPHLSSLGECLAAYEDKNECWSCRQESREFLVRYLASAPGNTQVRIKNALFKVKTSDGDFNGDGNHWPAKYVELNDDEVPALLEKQRVLSCAALRVRGILDVGQAVVRYARELQMAAEELFANAMDVSPAWETVLGAFSKSKDNLQLVTGERSSAGIHHYHWNGQHLRLPATAPSSDDFEVIVKDFGKMLDGIQRDVHCSLLEHFRPNQARPPLPKIFKIDLTPPAEQRTGIELSLTHHSFDQRSLEEVVIAVASVGVPPECYRENETRLKDECRGKLRTAASVLLRQAASAGAHVLVLPELFIPSSDSGAFFQEVAKGKVICIAGIEGGRHERSGLDFNTVGVQFPGRPLVEQYKHFPSKYEHDRLFAKGGIHLFENTEIGNFAVVICSDYRESNALDVLQRGAKQLDFLFVCANNPRPEHFQHMAIADSYRLYSTIVVSDSHATNGGAPQGSCVVQPRTENPLIKPKPGDVIDLSAEVASLGSVKPELHIYRLSPGSFARKRGMQAREFAPCPFSRRLV